MKFRTLLVGLVSLGCTSAPPPKSAPLAVTDVKIHQSANRPKLVKLERSGDPSPALAIAILHGLDSHSGREWAARVQTALSAVDLHMNVRSFETGLLLSVPLDATTSAINPIKALRDAVQAAPIAKLPNPLPLDACGLLESARQEANVTPGYHNIVLGAVGSKAALDRVTNWYNSAGDWVTGSEPHVEWPTQDTVQSDHSTDDAGLLIARRTPLRSRSMQAAEVIGQPDSTLALLAHSFPGQWQLLEAQSNYVPGGSCLLVRLQAKTTTGPSHAARVARAVAAELEWVLTQQVEDQDPRLVALEGLTAVDAAERAAWLEAVELVPVVKESSSFVHYRGPRGDTSELGTQWNESPSSRPLPLATQDEPGQGHVWAALMSRCAVQQEDDATAGHVYSALLAAAESLDTRHPVKASLNVGHVSIQTSVASRNPGAEDMAAEVLARTLLQFHRDVPRIAEVRTALAATLANLPTWGLALKLATGGHPSWLTSAPTSDSLLTLDPTSSRQALEVFAGSPLEVHVLTTQGNTQAERLTARLSHLLSGLRQREYPCLPPSARLQKIPPSGEYWVEAPLGTPAVMLYVLDGRFADVVRKVEQALNRTGGWLERGLPATTFQARVFASGLGSNTTLSALAFTIAAENDEQLTITVAQLRELVRRLTVANLVPQPKKADSNEQALPERRLQRLGGTVTDEKALLDELLTRALPTAPLVYVKPVQTN